MWEYGSLYTRNQIKLAPLLSDAYAESNVKKAMAYHRASYHFGVFVLGLVGKEIG